MTKSQLLRVLEPFNDDISILLLAEGNYKHNPRVFYHISGDGDGSILLVTNYLPHGKAVELKV